MIINSKISQLDSMYPSEGIMVLSSESYTGPAYLKYGSVYGYCFGNTTIVLDDKTIHLEEGQYFSFFVKENITVTTESKTFLVIRLGYKAVNQSGWVEKKGRLSYIDGCSDSLLIFPNRLGDPSLNLLYFPETIDQTFHIHPSIRIGCVIDGAGFSDVKSSGTGSEIPLNTGDIFCLEEQESHRFKTKNNSMTVIAWHPDGDWGPTDHNHSMINRTYLSEAK
jgi:hypothetical protein